jgi:Phage integrase family
MERACKVAGIPHFTHHDLPHRYTSLLVLAGVPLPLVRMIVGHARASVTLDVYSHVLLDEPPDWPRELRAGVTPVLPNSVFEDARDDESPAQRGFPEGSGGYRDRTGDLRLAKAALSQLS